MTLQGIAAVAAGFIAMTAIVMIGSVVLSAVIKRPALSRRLTYLVGDLVLGLFAALGGGMIAARMAPFAGLEIMRLRSPSSCWR